MDDGKNQKRALATMGRLKGHLRRIEGLFTGFQNNLHNAYQTNKAFQGEVKDLQNAAGHDTWKTIGYSIAAVGLSAVAGFGGSPQVAGAAGAGIAAFGSSQAGAKQIKAYQASLQPYAQLVQRDMRATEEIMNMGFNQGEKMLTGEQAFSREEWSNSMQRLNGLLP